MLASSSRRKKKKKNKRRKLRDAEIDGCRIAGLDKTDTYNPWSEDEENSNTARQDDHILKKLFKKTGIAPIPAATTLVSLFSRCSQRNEA